jgi:callose synthase
LLLILILSVVLLADRYVESEEYKNMKERLEFQEHVVPHESGDTAHVPYHWQLDLQENACLMTRLWCSYRHQTLARTIRGIHNYEKALALLGEHEIGSNSTAGTTDVKHYALLLARHKCCLVVSCQIFGKWEDDFKRHKAGELATGDAEKFEAICFLMQKYQNLRVAYIDERNSRVYSVLVRGAAAGSTDYYQTVYRIELPGHPIKDGIGEGKPENQNHAMIFTRGTCVQTVDMNQDGYFEECLKVRNILQEFRPAPGTSRPVSIVGFAEHPYSRHFGAASEFAAMEELSFTSVGQRAAQFPFEVRYHYGHPDFHHRIRACTNGSVSKAIKTLCVSEDVYGGWNAVQRNGCILYREYKNVGKGKDLAMEAVSAFQAKIACGSAEMHFSRDYRRILDSQNLARALSMFHSSTGFFWSNVLVVWLVYFTVYEYVFLAMMIPHEHQDELRHMLQAHSSLLSFGLLLALSLFGELMLRHGVMHAVLVFIGLFIRGAPIFYLFQIVWKAKTFLDALTRQTATYRATGRGLILTRSSFATIYRTYSCSHFNLGVEILAGLIAYSYYSEASTLSLANIILPLLLFVGTVILVPFVFNFRQFDQEEIHADWTEWLQFMNEHDSSPGSWQDWYSSQCASYQSPAMTRGFALTMVMRSSLLLLVPFFVILKYSKVILDPKRDGMFVIVIVLLIGLSFASLDSRMHLRHESRLMAIRRRGYRRVCASPCRCIGRCVTEQSFGLVLCGVTLGILSFGTNRLYGSEHHLLIDWTVLLAYTGAWLVNLFFYAGFHCNPWVRKAYYVLDFAVGTMILFILWLVSLFSFVGQMHAQLLFNSVVVRGLSRVEARRTADI